ARPEYASSWRQLPRCLPRSLLHAIVMADLSPFLPRQRPVSFPILECVRIESRLPWPAHRDAARARAPCGVDPVLLSIFVAPRELLSLSATLLLARTIFPLSLPVLSQV